MGLRQETQLAATGHCWYSFYTTTKGLDQATDYWPWTTMMSRMDHREGGQNISNTRPNSTECHGTMRHIRRSVHQNISRQGSQTIVEPSIMCPLSIIILASPILVVGAYQAAHYTTPLLRQDVHVRGIPAAVRSMTGSSTCVPYLGAQGCVEAA